ncbi:MAG: MoaD/ThiS family protein [Desulfobulbales bacterium]|jgi:molybdopterin converting factor small subunit
MPKVIVPFSCRNYTDNQHEINMDGESLEEIMKGLWSRHPGLKTILDDTAMLSIFVNSRLVTTGIEKWDAVSLNKEDEIALIIPIAGG